MFLFFVNALLGKWGCSSQNAKGNSHDDVVCMVLTQVTVAIASAKYNDDVDAQSTLRQFKNVLEMKDKSKQMLGITG